MAIQEVPNKVTVVGQTASIPATQLFAVGPTGGGMYAIWADVIVTTAGSAGTVTVTVSWDNGTTLASLFSSAFSLTSVGEQAALLGNFMVSGTPSQNVNYSTTVSGAVGGPVYTLNLRLQYLG